MYLAKIALDITAKNSPDFIGYLDEKLFKQTLWNHRPITDFWGISNGTANMLKKLGIFDMEGISKTNEEYLYNAFGINAELLIDHANGVEPCLMEDIKNYKTKSKSLSSSQILPCNYVWHDALIVLLEMIQNGCYDLFIQHYITGLISIVVGYGDNDKEFVKGSTRLANSTNLYSSIRSNVVECFTKIIDKNRPIRRIGYSFSALSNDKEEQFDMFTDYKKVHKEKKLMSSVIEVKEKFGKNAIFKGVDLTEKATQRERNKSIGGHSSGEK